MEKASVRALLEKYWHAETTVEEERALADYFRGPYDPDPELEPYRDLFRYFGQEAQVTAGPDFGTRILRHVGLSPAREERSRRATGLPAGRTFRLGFISAAASICAIVAGLLLLTPHSREQHRNESIASTPMRDNASTAIHDTYEDPEQALAAVRHALLVASTHLNEGRRTFTGQKN